MLNIVIFGAPGSGKGTQSDKLIDHYKLFHISTGDVLRDNIKRGTELGKIAKGYIDQGQLVPDELIIDILAQVLDENKDNAHEGVIFDGFPRTIPQAEALEQLLADLIAFGNGLFKGNLQAIVGQMYDNMEADAVAQGKSEEEIKSIKDRRDSGFQIFYVFINIGGLIAPFVAPLLRVGERWSRRPMRSMKYRSASSTSCGVAPSSTRTSIEMMPLTMMASLSACRRILPSMQSACSHTRLWQPSIRLSAVLYCSSSAGMALPISIMTL